jgi:pyruvate/2-oxoglutarate dehydrogenase complex dihydrolipoamide acyltransferase (E2) component
VANGEHVQEGQALAEVEGSKAVFTIPAPVAGIVSYALEPGSEILVGAALCLISNGPATVRAGAVAARPEPVPGSRPREDGSRLPERTPTAHELETAAGPPRFSRGAAAALQQHGLDPQRFAGLGLVRASDVLAILGGNRGSEAAAAPSAAGARPGGTDTPVVPASRVPFRSEPLSRSKQTEIRYLTAGYRQALPSVVTVAVPTRGLRAAVAEGAGAPGSTLAIVVFEVARLLRRYARFNAFYAEGAAHIYEAVNIGVALDAGHGLKVPVIHQADTKSLPEIAARIQALLRRYLDNALQLDDLTGATFTISDLSAEGVLTFHPLITQGQGAILGIGSEHGGGPGAGEGFFTLILAFDHQLAEGRQAAQFLQELAPRLRGYEAAMLGPGSRFGEPRCERCLTSLSRLRQLDAGPSGAHVLVPTIQPDGTRAYRCSLCLQGW